MRTRGLGRIYQPKFRDRKTGEQHTSPTWWIGYSYRGVKHRESSKSTKKSDAVRLLRRRLEEMSKGVVVGPVAEKLMATEILDLVTQDYVKNSRKSLSRVGTAMLHLTAFFGTDLALDVTPTRVNRYIALRQDAPAKPASIRYELAILKRGFSLAVKQGLLSHRPYIPGIVVDNVRTGFFEPDEFRRVLGYLPPEIQPAVFFAYATGWRIQSEVLPLEWRHVDLRAGIVRLDAGMAKNKEGRTFPFAVLPHLATILERQRQQTLDVERETGTRIPWVFHRRGQRIKNFRGAWKSACANAQVPGRIPHDFRRTAVRNLERAGVSRSVAMKLTGHKTEAVYRRYAITSEADLAEGIMKLAKLHDRDQPDPLLLVHERAKQGQSNDESSSMASPAVRVTP
jgi:integrase